MRACLEEMKILELSHYIAAPLCGQLLGDLGAKIIKVERPGEGKGDAGRENAPFHNGVSLYYAAYNRNKRTLTLDINTEEGKEIFKDLVRQSDVVIQNFRPGVLEKLGLGYEDLKKINPELIMTSISGYGQTGPYKNRAALDMTIQAVSGFMSVTGTDTPMKSGPVISDFVTALYGAIGTIAAYVYRGKTGKGQHVDLALLDCMFTFLENFPVAYKLQGIVPPRSGNTRPWTAPCNIFKTKDGYVQLNGTQNALFKKLCQAMKREDLVDDPEMLTPRLRKTNEARIENIINEWISQFTSDEAVEVLEKYGVPNGKVNSVSEITNHEQIAAREMMRIMKDAIFGEFPIVANPIKMSESEIVYNEVATKQGAYTDSILKDNLGFTDERIQYLRNKGIV